jgi:hypothetical protein
MVVAPLARQADDAALRFPNSTRLGSNLGVLDPLVPALPGPALVPRNKEEVGRQLDSRTQTVVTSGKRFKPLTMMRSPSVMPSNRKKRGCHYIHFWIGPPAASWRTLPCCGI